MSRARVLLLVLCGLLLALGVGFATPACSRNEGPPPVDTEIMAFLSEARALHHQANLAEESGDLAGAVKAMDRLVTARRPHPERKTPEVEEVLGDAYARIAELRMKLGDLIAAHAAVTNGLEHVAEATYFRGHLLEMEALIEEARAAQLADAGEVATAKQASERAIQLFEEVVKIQDQVIQRSLAKDGSAEGPR